MTFADKVRGYLMKNPGSTCQQIAVGAGIPRKNADVTCTYCFREGSMDRKLIFNPDPVIGSKAQVWAYSLKDWVKVQVPVEEKVQAPILPPVLTKAPALTQETPLTKLEVALSSFVEEVASSLAERILASLHLKLDKAIDGIKMPSMAQEIGVISSRKNLKKVLIIGLKGNQEQEVRKEFSELFDLRFINGGTSDKLRSMAKNMDYVLSHVAHSSHAVENSLKTVGITPIRVNGGTTQLTEKLTEIYANS